MGVIAKQSWLNSARPASTSTLWPPDSRTAVYLIPSNSIATIGDMPNDVLMFKKSGMSIAMGNASKEVQAEANFVTASNEEEGFARAIERFVLN
jgi:hydroxymethylpyrimidine pyrophosphatase-like HAD family hydrolase